MICGMLSYTIVMFAMYEKMNVTTSEDKHGHNRHDRAAYDRPSTSANERVSVGTQYCSCVIIVLMICPYLVNLNCRDDLCLLYHEDDNIINQLVFYK